MREIRSAPWAACGLAAPLAPSTLPVIKSARYPTTVVVTHIQRDAEGKTTRRLSRPAPA